MPFTALSPEILAKFKRFGVLHASNLKLFRIADGLRKSIRLRHFESGKYLEYDGTLYIVTLDRQLWVLRDVASLSRDDRAELVAILQELCPLGKASCVPFFKEELFNEDDEQERRSNPYWMCAMNKAQTVQPA